MTTQMLDEVVLKSTLFSILGSIAPETDFEALNPDADLRATLDIDSFDFLNVLIALDEQVGVAIPEADYGRLVSLNDIIAYVTARLA